MQALPGGGEGAWSRKKVGKKAETVAGLHPAFQSLRPHFPLDLWEKMGSQVLQSNMVG